MRELIIIFMSMMLVNNFVLTKFLGICPFLGVSKKLPSSVGMSVAVTFVMVMATAVTHPLYRYILVPFKVTYLQTVAFILIIAALVQLVEIVLKKFIPALYSSLGIFLPLITTNCAVLGVTILNITEDYDFITAMVNSLGAGVGFLLAMVIFTGVRSKLDTATEKIPSPFRGLPITLIAAGIVSMVFAGFTGVVEGIFGI